MKICCRHAKWILGQWSKNSASIGEAQKTISMFLHLRNFLPSNFQGVQLTSETLKACHVPYQLPRQDPIEKCKPQLQLAFAKTHKTGSSTLQNIIFRWRQQIAWDKIKEKPTKALLGFSPLWFPSKYARSCLIPGTENGTICHLLCQREAMSSLTGSPFTLQWWGSRFPFCVFHICGFDITLTNTNRKSWK